MIKEIKLAIANLKLLFKTPLHVPAELDKNGYHTHYAVGIMATMIAFIATYVALQDNVPNGLLLLLTVIGSFILVFIIAYMKEKYDEKVKKTFMDVNDIRFTMYGWLVATVVLTIISIFI